MLRYVVGPRPFAVWFRPGSGLFNRVVRMVRRAIVPTEGGIPIKLEELVIGGVVIGDGTPGEDERNAHETLEGLGCTPDFAARNRPATRNEA